MPTVEQAAIYNNVRKNVVWEELTPTQAQTLLNDAEDYIRQVYPIRSALSQEEGRMFDALIMRLAGTFQTTPPSPAVSAAIKSESTTLGTLKTDIEFFQADNDPYPRITAMVRPFLVRPPSTGGVRTSRMVR